MGDGPGSDGGRPDVGGRRGFSTRAVHGAPAPAVHQLPASVPIYQTATWGFGSLDEFAAVLGGEAAGHTYGRGYGNPTVEAFEAVMADLEGTEAAMAFDSGMAAIHATVTTLAAAGDRVVASRHLYGGTHSLFTSVLPRYGVEVAMVDVDDPAALAGALDGAACCYLETVGNPMLVVPDLPRVSAACAAAGVPVVVDNTFASPWLCTPAAHGADYVVHSATKYIGGHSDLLGGVVCTSGARRAALRATALEVGGAMQPLEAGLGLRGLATLELRLARQSATAAALAERLAAAPGVAAVHYPGRAGGPAAALLRAGGGMVSFDLAGGQPAARAFCDALEVAWIGASLGGAHTLVAHPASTTHRQLDPAARAAQGITDGLVRLSVGLEDPADLLADIERGLAAAG